VWPGGYAIGEKNNRDKILERFGGSDMIYERWKWECGDLGCRRCVAEHDVDMRLGGIDDKRVERVRIFAKVGLGMGWVLALPLNRTTVRRASKCRFESGEGKSK